MSRMKYDGGDEPVPGQGLHGIKFPLDAPDPGKWVSATCFSGPLLPFVPSPPPTWFARARRRILSALMRPMYWVIDRVDDRERDEY